MNIILYKSTTCPQCKVAKIKLESKGISFTEELDISVMESRGVRSIPTLEVDGTLYTSLREINNWIKSQEATNG